MSVAEEHTVRVRVYHPEFCGGERSLDLLRRWWAEMEPGMRKNDLGLTLDLLERVLLTAEHRWH